MSGLPQWPSDQPIFDLIAQVKGEATELMEDHGAGLDLDHRLYGLAATLLSISPRAVEELFETFAEIAGVQSRDVMDDALGAIDSSLGEWDGAAAEAFTQHMDHVRGFNADQVAAADKLLLYLRGAYMMALHARDDMQKMMETWLDTSRRFREDEEEKRNDTYVKIGAAIIAAALAIPTGGTSIAAAGGVFAASASVAITAEVLTTMGGASPDDVFASACKAIDELGRRYDDGIREFRSDMSSYMEAYVRPMPSIFRPLPSTTDVDSPDFRYEHFYSDHRMTSTYAAQVAPHREAYVAEKSSGDSLISRRLGGDDA